MKKPLILMILDGFGIAPPEGNAIAAAKKRFTAGNLIPTNEGYRGAVRVREKTAAEVSAERKEREERHKKE